MCQARFGGGGVGVVPVGRGAEIAEISSFLSVNSAAPAALAITGVAGIGKTTVWKHVVHEVSPSSIVLSCQPTSAERPLAFSALDDLFGNVAAEVLSMLPAPRRQAVETALCGPSQGSSPADHPEAGGVLPDQQLLARGILEVLRILSGDSRIVLAIDDVQWLDPPSARVLEFCFRRLRSEPVSLVLSRHGTGGSFPFRLDRVLPPDRLLRVQLGPLSPGAIGGILRSQLGALLPRYTFTRLHEACGGNPFYALESARTLTSHPRIPCTNEPISIPPSLIDLVRGRVRGLTPDARQVSRLIAASSAPRERVICAAYCDEESWTAIDQAIDQGVIERNGETLRFTHPLLRSALYAEMRPDERRSVHNRLATVAVDIEERAWHLALAADRPLEETAGILDTAAKHAASRGAPGDAAALQEQATRLTPASQSGAARERTINAADYHFRAGDIDRSRELIESMLPGCPAGPLNASLLLRLATIHYHLSGWPLAEQKFRQAAREALEHPALRAHAEQELAFVRLVAGDLPGACNWAHVSLCSAEQAADPHLIAQSLARIALFEFLRGNTNWPELLERAEAVGAPADEEPIGRLPMLDTSLIAGVIFKWCDRLNEARLKLVSRYRHALDRGDEVSLPYLLYHLSQLECWAGKWDAAEEYALEACRAAEETCQQPMRPAALYSLALVRAHQGRLGDARHLASEALTLCDRTGNAPIAWQAVSVLGFAALSLDDYEATHSHLGRLAEMTAATGLGEPGVVKFLPDEIEALAALGEIDLAEKYTRRLLAQGESLGRPWALATGARCRAHLAAVDGDLDTARAACQQALSAHQQLPMPFELGRTLLLKGIIERRGRCKSAARASLCHALSVFEQVGAPLWAGKARRELSKIALRPTADGLTGTEQRVAALIAQGRTNREIAAAMFLTENTVQTHLRHIFQKLGVRSRTELAARLLSASASTATDARSGVGQTIADQTGSAASVPSISLIQGIS
jgi:DNA-binding CsgD family transcriptional regulator/tetratricopeptide (TPR) repeat protein